MGTPARRQHPAGSGGGQRHGRAFPHSQPPKSTFSVWFVRPRPRALQSSAAQEAGAPCPLSFRVLSGRKPKPKASAGQPWEKSQGDILSGVLVTVTSLGTKSPGVHACPAPPWARPDSASKDADQKMVSSLSLPQLLWEPLNLIQMHCSQGLNIKQKGRVHSANFFR